MLPTPSVNCPQRTRTTEESRKNFKLIAQNLAAEDDEPGFSTSPCMMALVEMSKGKKLMDRKSELTKKRKMRCGNCDKCMKVDCDYCTGCQGMTKFGGTGRPTELSISSLPVISQSLSSKLPEKSSLSTLNVTLCLVLTLSFTWT